MTNTNCWSCTADYSKDMPEPGKGGAAGYATLNHPTESDQTVKICYDCAAERERTAMLATGRVTLYLSGDKVTNWTGRITIPAMHIKRGRHNIASVRRDVWFRYEGAQWHGVIYGENTELLHCKRLKSRPISY